MYTHIYLEEGKFIKIPPPKKKISLVIFFFFICLMDEKLRLMRRDMKIPGIITGARHDLFVF